jgi:hypothetical protein
LILLGFLFLGVPDYIKSFNDRTRRCNEESGMAQVSSFIKTRHAMKQKY